MFAKWTARRAQKPTNSDKALRDADKAMRQRNWTQAAELYRLYLSDQGDDAPILVQLGHALKESGSLDEALQAYQRAVTAAPHDQDAIVHYAALLRRVGGNVQQALSTLSPSVAPGIDAERDRAAASGLDQPPASVAAVAWADVLRDLGKWDAAAEHYRRHLYDHPNDAGIWVQLGHMLKELSLFNEAIFAYKVARRLEAEPSDVGMHLAELLGRLGRVTEARPLWASLYRDQARP